MANVSKEQKLQQVVDAFHQCLQQHQDWSIVRQKDLQNGLQLLVTDGHTNVSVDCFTNGNALIQGSAGTLRTELQRWWKQQKEVATASHELVEPPSSIQSKVEAFQSFATQQGWSVASRSMDNGIYQLRMTSGRTSTPINFYPKGTVVIQGSPSTMKQTLEVWWKQQSNQTALPSLWEEASHEEMSPSVVLAEEKTIAKRTGIHEAGNDDYFGPLVIIGLHVDERTEARLMELGVRDSAWLPDNIILSLAEDIKELCRGQGHRLVYQPERYNKLYQETANADLLRSRAYAHVIAKLQEQHPSEYAAVNSFGDEALVPDALQAIGCQLPVEQGSHTSDDISVTAAYILARAEFVQQISKLSQQVGVLLPKGNSNPDIITVGREVVAQGGRDALGKVAKLHFEMTQQIRQQ